MPTPLKLALAVAILGIAVAGALIVGSPSLERSDLSDTSSLSAVEPEPLGASPDGQWEASRPEAFGLPAGDYLMGISLTPALTVSGPGDRLILLGERDDIADGVVSLGATDRCDSPGTYGWSLSPDFRTLSVSVGSDDCLDRSAVLAGDWSRTGIGRPLLVPERPYRADIARPVTFAVPTGFMYTWSGEPPQAGTYEPDGVVIDAEDHWAFIQTSGEVLADRCDQEAGMRPPISSIQDFLDWNRATTGSVVSDPVPTTVDGHEAVYVDIAGTDACPHASLDLQDCECMYPGYVSGDGFQERTWGVDLGDGQVAIVGYHDDNPPFTAATPERLALAQRLVDSIQFP